MLINLTLFTDISAAARSDRLEDALDYRELRDRRRGDGRGLAVLPAGSAGGGDSRRLPEAPRRRRRAGARRQAGRAAVRPQRRRRDRAGTATVTRAFVGVGSNIEPAGTCESAQAMSRRCGWSRFDGLRDGAGGRPSSRRTTTASSRSRRDAAAGAEAPLREIEERLGRGRSGTGMRRAPSTSTCCSTMTGDAVGGADASDPEIERRAYLAAGWRSWRRLSLPGARDDGGWREAAARGHAPARGVHAALRKEVADGS